MGDRLRGEMWGVLKLVQCSKWGVGRKFFWGGLEGWVGGGLACSALGSVFVNRRRVACSSRVVEWAFCFHGGEREVWCGVWKIWGVWMLGGEK